MTRTLDATKCNKHSSYWQQPGKEIEQGVGCKIFLFSAPFFTYNPAMIGMNSPKALELCLRQGSNSMIRYFLS